MGRGNLEKALEDLVIGSDIPGCGCESCQFRYLVDDCGLSEDQAREIIWDDGSPFSLSDNPLDFDDREDL